MRISLHSCWNSYSVTNYGMTKADVETKNMQKPCELRLQSAVGEPTAQVEIVNHLDKILVMTRAKALCGGIGTALTFSLRVLLPKINSHGRRPANLQNGYRVSSVWTHSRTWLWVCPWQRTSISSDASRFLRLMQTQHPTEASKFKGTNLYCHRDCYHDARATKKAKFSFSCAVCSEKIPIGEGITKNVDGKWVHDPPCKSAIRVNRKLSAEEHDRMALLSVITPSDCQLYFLQDQNDGPTAKLAKNSHSSTEQSGMGYAIVTSLASDALLRQLEVNADYLHLSTGTGSTIGDLDDSQGTTIAADKGQEGGAKL
ncbi:hypothetical protein B484DRAFT_436972 [Ochromonadaceae sp. CCMP2298]|nr:hypothetical protein B484DRAFT_436972 [Ochromonadaceae sp. CCMP2298]